MNNPYKLNEDSAYYRIFSNRPFVLLWSGQTISIFGDAFFNLAVMWVVYEQSGSTLQTAFIQVVWQLSAVFFGPVSGVFVDRWDRKFIIVIVNLLSAMIVGGVAFLVSKQGQATPIIIFIAIFLLNSLNTFINSARFSIVPAIVERDLLSTASGLFSTARHFAFLLGNMLSGVVVSMLGIAWVLIIDMVSFLFAALFVIAAKLPAHPVTTSTSNYRSSFLQEIIAGWQAISNQSVIRMLIWFGLLINVTSYLGALSPAIVSQRLHGGAVEYGALEAVSVIGGIIGGLSAGRLERYFGSGRLLILSWALSGLSVLGIAASTMFILTAVLEIIWTFAIIVGGVASDVLMQAFSAEHYRGRIQGIASSLFVIVIPPSTIIAGWLADIFGAAPIFALGGCGMLVVAGMAWCNSHIREARIPSG